MLSVSRIAGGDEASGEAAEIVGGLSQFFRQEERVVTALVADVEAVLREAEKTEGDEECCEQAPDQPLPEAEPVYDPCRADHVVAVRMVGGRLVMVSALARSCVGVAF